MKKKLLVFAMLLATTLFWLPSNSSVSAQEKEKQKNRGNHSTIWQPGQDNGTWRKKDAHGYRNYGQYRRTQVGNRRSHLVRRYYVKDGTRLSRLIRVFY